MVARLLRFYFYFGQKFLLSVIFVVSFVIMSFFLNKNRVFLFNYFNEAPQDSFTITVPELSDLEKLTLNWKNKYYGGPDEYILYTNMRLGHSPVVLHNNLPLSESTDPVMVNNLTSITFPIDVQPCNNNTKLLVGVVTATGNLLKRLAIRESWAKNLNPSISRIVFIVGLTIDDEKGQVIIKEESAIYDDVIQSSVVDTYDNLSQKSVALFKWVDANCPKVDFFLKCDDDVFVNVYNLNIVLKSVPINEKRIYGARHGGRIVDRPEPLGK